MPLEELGISGASNSSGITDLSPLRGMKLRTLEIAQNKNLVDISPLAGMPLNRPGCHRYKNRVLEPLRGMKLLQLSLIKTV